MSFIKVYSSGSFIVLEDDFKGSVEKYRQGDLEYFQNADGSIGISHIGKNQKITTGFTVGTYQNQAGTPYADFATLEADWDSFLQPTSTDELKTVLDSIATNTAGSAVTNFISTDNSTTSLLGAGASFTGVSEDVSNYTTIAVAFNASAKSDGTLYFEVSQDNVNFISIPFSIPDASIQTPKIWNVVEKYYRLKYTNGATPQSGTFQLQTKYSNGQELGLLTAADQELTAETSVQATKSIITGQNKAGEYKSGVVDSEGHIKVHLHDPTTAFGEIKVAEETPIIQSKFPYNINSRLFNVTELNGGTVTQADSMAIVRTNVTANGTAIIESKKAIKYEPGKGVIAKFTSVFTTGVADNKQYIGIGDALDGFFVGFNGTTFGIVRRQNGVDNFTAQTDFNVDKLDGTGVNNPSAINLDPTKGNIFQIKFQWLGFGAITFSTEDPLEGDIEPFHIIRYAGAFTVPSIYNPTLPMRIENTNSNGSTTDVTMKSASMMAAIEGKRVVDGATFSHKKTGSTSTPHGFSIRNKSTYAGIANRASLYIKTFTAVNDGTSTTTYTLEEDAVLSGGSWVDIDTNDSFIEYNDTATITTPGTEIIPFSIAKNTGVTENLQDQMIELRPGQTLTIRTSNGNATDFALSWNEDI